MGTWAFTRKIKAARTGDGILTSNTIVPLRYEGTKTSQGMQMLWGTDYLHYTFSLSFRHVYKNVIMVQHNSCCSSTFRLNLFSTESLRWALRCLPLASSGCSPNTFYCMFSIWHWAFSSFYRWSVTLVTIWIKYPSRTMLQLSRYYIINYKAVRLHLLFSVSEMLYLTVINLRGQDKIISFRRTSTSSSCFYLLDCGHISSLIARSIAHGSTTPALNIYMRFNENWQRAILKKLMLHISIWYKWWLFWAIQHKTGPHFVLFLSCC